MSVENLSMTSDYPMDKIIYFHEGEYDFSRSLITPAAIIPHGLPFAPLVFAVFSLDNWQTTLTEPNESPNTICVVDSTNINLYAYRGAGGRFKIRIFGFEPSDSSAILSPTSAQASSFILNSDFNYLKLYMADKGVVDGSGNAAINHNLGFVPIALVWYEYLSGSVRGLSRIELSENLTTDNPTGLEITANQLILHHPTNINPNSTFHYRIYYNET